MKMMSAPWQRNRAPRSMSFRPCSGLKQGIPQCLPASRAAFATDSIASWTLGWSNWPGMPPSTVKSAGPKKSTSTPSTSAISRALATACSSSIWITRNVCSLASRMYWSIGMRAVRHVGIAAVEPAPAERGELRPGDHLAGLRGVVAARVHDPLGPRLEHPAHPHELALGRPGHDVDRSHAGSPHQLVGRLHAVPVVLHVHPDAVEAHQARQLVDRRVDQVEAGDQHRLVPLQLRPNLARPHSSSPS